MNQRQLNKLAAELGFDENEVKLALLLLAERGNSNKDAEQGLRSASERMKEPPVNLVEILQTFGIQFKDASGNIIGLATLCDMLRKKREEHEESLSLTYLLGNDADRMIIGLVNGGFGVEYVQGFTENSLQHKKQLLSQEKMTLWDQIKDLPDYSETDQSKRIAEIDKELWKVHELTEQQKEAK